MSEKSTNVTIRDVLQFLAPGVDSQDLYKWPPDAFAVVAYLLHKTGAYRMLVVENYWSEADQSEENWLESITQVAGEWKDTAKRDAKPPQLIRKWWSELLAELDCPLQEVYHRRKLCSALLDLCAAADQTCVGVGIPVPLTKDKTEFLTLAHGELLDPRPREDIDVDTGENSSTLCHRVNRRAVIVLPKLHTPQTGMTLRSLSLYLAMCEVGEVTTKWAMVPARLATEPLRHGLNLLLVPWPREVSPLDFDAVDNVSCGRHKLAPAQRYFNYQVPAWDEQMIEEFEALVADAQRKVGRIDGVILPELSVSSEKEYAELCKRVTKVNPEAFLVAGVNSTSAGEAEEGENCVMYCVPMAGGVGTVFKQTKHHRWRIEGAQVQQYGLGHVLDPTVSWWEHIRLNSRDVYFFSAAPWLTFCFLLCEDLARQDPTANLLRSVGPNLVIALLMDGPQLKERWPARYATVLADDPGSSVLTLTSIGMTLRSRRQSADDNEEPSRTVALWKDNRGATREIELAKNSGGVILTLARRQQKEYTADGRDDVMNDGITAAALTLCDVIQVPDRSNLKIAPAALVCSSGEPAPEPLESSPATKGTATATDLTLNPKDAMILSLIAKRVYDAALSVKRQKTRKKLIGALSETVRPLGEALLKQLDGDKLSAEETKYTDAVNFLELWGGTKPDKGG